MMHLVAGTAHQYSNGNGWSNPECVPGAQLVVGQGATEPIYCTNFVPSRYGLNHFFNLKLLICSEREAESEILCVCVEPELEEQFMTSTTKLIFNVCQ